MDKFKSLEEYINTCYNESCRQGFNIVYFIADYITKSYVCIQGDIIMPSHIEVNSEEGFHRILSPILKLPRSSQLLLNPCIIFFNGNIVVHKDVDLFIKGEGSLKFTIPKYYIY